MLITDKISESGDPSSDIQKFKHLKFNILCCRYWWFEIWKGQRMSFPYWRLYWNKNEGAYVYYEEKLNLVPDHIYLIPPHTPYSTGIINQRQIEESDYFFKCGKIDSTTEETHRINRGDILHFFIHFTLGANYDRVKPGIYQLKVTPQKMASIKSILIALKKGSDEFSLYESLDIYDLVISSVNSVISNISLEPKIDQRVADTIDYMEKNLNEKMTDENLAKKLFMSTSAFSRLFKKNTGKSPSEYLRQIRIENASNLLIYSTSSIDTIAHKCGFSDRYHLTKVFGKMKSTSPAAFRKSIGYF